MGEKGLENSGPSSPTLIKTGAAMVLSITTNGSLDLKTEAAYSRLADFRTSHDENKQRRRSVSGCLWFLFSFSLFHCSFSLILLDRCESEYDSCWKYVESTVGSVAYNCVVLWQDLRALCLSIGKCWPAYYWQNKKVVMISYCIFPDHKGVSFLLNALKGQQQKIIFPIHVLSHPARLDKQTSVSLLT